MNDNVMTVAGGGGRRNDASSSASPLPMNPKMVAENEPTPHEPWKNGEKKARPHPGLLPQEKESLFPRLVDRNALRLRGVQGFNARNFYGKSSPAPAGEGHRGEGEVVPVSGAGGRSDLARVRSLNAQILRGHPSPRGIFPPKSESVRASQTFENYEP